MNGSVALEFRKMRRLRTIPLLVSIIIAVAALSSASLFSGNTRDTLADPAAHPWAVLLLSYTMMAAMTSPIIAAILASRQTDIEHSGIGWILAGTAGRTPGSLCLAKLGALAILLAPAVGAQSFLVAGIGFLAGIRVPFDATPWLMYTLLLYLVDVAFCALHIWLAALVENQLVSVGVGLLGAFLAVFSLLMPSGVGSMIPWGYYAVVSHAAQVEGQVRYVSAPYGLVALFLVLVAIVFAVAVRRLDRVER